MYSDGDVRLRTAHDCSVQRNLTQHGCFPNTLSSSSARDRAVDGEYCEQDLCRLLPASPVRGSLEVLC